MALSYAPITELEAVNGMLASIGEQPVSSIPSSGVSEAMLAQTALHNTSRAIQTKGLHCNTDRKYSLSPNGSNEIVAPSNSLRIDPWYQYQDFVVRAGKLYDIENQTYEFTAAVKVEIVWFLQFGQLPEHVRHYIYIKAARKFQADVVGSENLHNFSANDEYEAKAEMERVEMKHKSHTLVTSVGVSHITDRRA